MDDVFTIVSIFIAVSGAAYTAIITWREVYKDDINKMEREAEEKFVSAIDIAVEERTKKNLNAKIALLRHWMFYWRRSLGIPVIFFAVTSYVLAIYLLIFCWHSTSVQSPHIWPISKWVLAIAMLVDAVGIFSIPICNNRIAQHSKDVLEWVGTANNERSRQFTPRRIIEPIFHQGNNPGMISPAFGLQGSPQQQGNVLPPP